MSQKKNSDRFLHASGTHREIGFSIGNHFAESIRSSVAKVFEEVSARMPAEEVRNTARSFADVIGRVAPHLTDELRGIARGADIGFIESLVLQLRFDLVGFVDGGTDAGCSSFAIAGNGIRYTGQNVDAPSWHKQTGAVVAIYPPVGPDILMYNYYPGMVGYVGFNSEGLSVFGNALVSEGWRIGVPRYIAVRLALETDSVSAAMELLNGLQRGSSINLVISDRDDRIIDLEVDVDEIGVVNPERSRIFHTNHYLSESMQARDRYRDVLPDSGPRLVTGQEALANLKSNVGKKSVLSALQVLLRNHDNGSASICRHETVPKVRSSDDWETVASIIADPNSGEMHVCFGNPCQIPYQTFLLARESQEYCGLQDRAVLKG